MTNETICRELFKGITLEVNDIYLLERFQISIMKNRLRPSDFATLLRRYPEIRKFLLVVMPSMEQYFLKILTESSPVTEEQQNVVIDRVLWTIADLILESKDPAEYDKRTDYGWDINEIRSIVPIRGVVLDAGARTGRIALNVAGDAELVYAVEPSSVLRRFIREKAVAQDLENVYPVDGFLHDLPFPANFADMLLSSHALGLLSTRELTEMDRVVKPGGAIIHLTGFPSDMQGSEFHRLLVDEHRYSFAEYDERDGRKLKYWKRVS